MVRGPAGDRQRDTGDDNCGGTERDETRLHADQFGDRQRARDVRVS